MEARGGVEVAGSAGGAQVTLAGGGNVGRG